MLHDVDRKIQKGKQRLQLMQRDHPPNTAPQSSKHQEQLNNLNARINKLLAEAEEAGIRGDVDQAQDLMTLCDELKEEKETLQQQHDAHLKQCNKLRAAPPPAMISSSVTGSPSAGDEQQHASPIATNSNDAGVNENSEANEITEQGTTETAAVAEQPAATGTATGVAADSTSDIDKTDAKPTDTKSAANWSHEALPEKQMKVCEICGAFLIVGDAQQRIEDHLMGKQHLGYSKLRNAVTEINERRQKEREEEERKRRDDRVQRFQGSYDNRR